MALQSDPYASSSFMVRIVPGTCHRCRSCIDICPEEALAWKNGRVIPLQGLCSGCGHCVQICPMNLLRLKVVRGPGQ